MKIATKNMKPVPQAPKNRGWFAPLLLLIVLALLFWRSFLPDFVHFNNDGPLGIQNTAFAHLPDGFKAAWDDLNSIGSSLGSYPLSITDIIHWGLGPVGYSKFLALIALWILGIVRGFASGK